MLANAYQPRDVATQLRDTAAEQHYRGGMPVDEPGVQRLAHIIRTTRDALGWTQPDLAEAAGVSRPTVQRYETGKTKYPEPDPVRRIFRALGLDPREIPVILGLVTREELDLPPVIEPVVRRFSDETERIIALLESDDVTPNEKKTLYEFLVARARPTSGQERPAG